MIRGYWITMILEKSKRKLLVLIITISFLVFQVSGAESTATATDVVPLSRIESDQPQILLLDIFNKNTASMGIYGTMHVGVAGSKPYDSGGSTYVAVFGGYLQYTLIRFTGTYRITVETTESGENYNNGALSVKIFNIYPGGSALETLGSFTGEYVPINSNGPQTLMTNIDGSNTWTGAGSGEGARLLYKLTGDPGSISGSKLPVLYTLISETQ